MSKKLSLSPKVYLIPLAYRLHIKLGFIFSLLYILLGCSTMSGNPQSPLDFTPFPNNGTVTSEKDLLNKYSQDFANAVISEPTSAEERNKLISKALTILDIRYSQFINDTELDRKNKEFVSDFVELSMNLAGAAVGSAGTKTILAAISAGVNGINGSIDKTYLYEKTFPSLVAQMNADRKTVHVFLLIGMENSLKDYPWARAVHDLVNYYNAGTLLGAISSIQKDAGNKESVADKRINKIIEVDELVSIDTVQLTRELIESLKKVDAETLKNINFQGISMDLSHVPKCNISSPQTDSKKAKNALYDCILEASPIEGKQDVDKAKDLNIIRGYFSPAGIVN